MGKKGSSFILIVSLLSSMVIQPAISVAISQSSEEPQQTEQSSGGLTTLSSDVLGNPNEPMVSEEEPANDEKEKDVFAEETYEARDLSKKDEDNASHPIVEVQMSQETLKGEIVLGSDPPNGNKTILKTIALQSKDESTEWQEVKGFEEGKDHVLNDSSFNFEFSDSLNDQDYRIVLDYVIEEIDEEQHVVRTFHKGQVLLDPVEPTEKGEEPPKTKVGTDETQIASTEPENDVVNKSSEFIGPRAVNDVVYNGTTSGGVTANVKIYSIKSREASIEFTYFNYVEPERARYVVWSTDPNRIINLCANISSASRIPSALWTQLMADGTNVVIPFQKSWSNNAVTFGPAKMTNLKPNTKYYIWLFKYNSSTGAGDWYHPDGTSAKLEKYIEAPYVFTTDSAVALSITAPTFTQTSATHNTIPMVGKAYTGDIFQTSGQGKVQVTSNDGTTVQDKVTNLGHTITQGGTYNSATVSGLTAGTRYKGRTALKDYGGNWKYSGWSSYFYTANTVNQPAAPTLNTPTASNNATAAVTATYNAGDVAAHPTSTDIQISTNNSTWTTITADTTPAVTNRVFNTGSKSVSFTLSKLNARTKYYVRYRVRNASNVWSGYSTAREFTTGAMTLSIGTPTFTQTTATHNAIYMTGTTYTGDIFQTSGQGKVQVTSNDGVTVQDKVTNLTHTVSRGGTYHNITVPGLIAGTRYKGRVAIKDYGGTWRYSAWSSYFYTVNTVNQPTVTNLNTPTTSTNATADVTATYNVGDVAAHPTSTDIQISTNNSTWTTITADTTPAITNRVFNTGNKSVSFTLSKLTSNTKYYVRYRVRNASNVWSGFSTSREFKTKGMALTYISNPTFSYTTSARKMILNEGTYQGNTYGGAENAQQGLHVKDNTGAWINVRGSIHQPISYASGKYAVGGYALPDELMPGTQYRSHVFIRDSENVWQESWRLNNNTYSYFYTKNEVNGVTNVTYTPAQTASSASASMTGVYKVSDYSQGQAHPKETGVTDGYDGQKGVDIQLRSSQDSNYSSWKSVKAVGAVGSPITVTSLTINSANKRIEFALGNMEANTTYEVQYRVKNDSNQWSEYSPAVSIRTNGIALQISPPVFDQETATATSVQLKQGTYTGDISQITNDGFVYTESYNSGTNDTDWTARVNDLQHTTTRNGTYSSALINGLTPGTRYKGWIQMKNLEGVVVGPVGQPAGAENEYFYTKNTLSSLSVPTLNTPVAEHGATAEFSVDYQAAGDHPDQPAAHPNNVKVYLSTDGVAFSEISSHQTSPSIDTFDIDTTNKKASVKIKNLTAGQTYHVKCSVVNQGGESEQTSARMFTTNQRQAGLYISDTPTFNFGVQSVNSSGTNAGLSNTQGTTDFGIKMENVGISSNWSFAARLSSLRTQDGSNQELTGAQLSFGKQLQKTTDGTTWQDVTQDFEGLSETTAILPADHSTTQLWKSTDISAGQGKFRTTIAFDSVNLLIPGNTAQKGAFYEGKIEWLMVNEP
ncbi:hypothetical protein [Enterococcus sp. AZ007]|uniref:hypothetical protein n=1 Tax=Enterococcus sp. AZ007 TaxID=2774839 RepID=UPI003F1FC9EA